MKITGSRLRREIALGLAILLAMPLAEGAAVSQQRTVNDQQPQIVVPAQEQSQGSGSRGQALDPNASKSDASSSDIPVPAQSQIAAQSGESAPTQATSVQQQDAAPKPVGSAAAPYMKNSGVAASRPAGAVIAPAKQRRARSIVIRVSIVVGAAVAIGTVVALSHSSPSRPN
jgi:hypothetical protein